MKVPEFLHILAAIIVFAAVAAFSSALRADWNSVALILLFSAIIVAVATLSKKIMGYSLDANVEHRVWMFSRYGFKPSWYLKPAIPAGIVLPIFLSFFSLGLIKFGGILTYETSALKQRAAKRFGFYSFTEMTEWHNALIGATGIVTLLALSVAAYFLNFGLLSKLSIYYAISNLLPISNFDGTQTFMGSKVLYLTLAIITLIFFGYALLLH